MSSAKSPTPLFHIGDWVAFDYGPRKVKAKVVEDRGPIGVHGRRMYRIKLNEESAETSAFEMPENELQETSPPLRQSFQIRYHRQGKTNIWRAITKHEGLLKGVKAKGAVSYSTALWEGETEDDLQHATVEVLLEIDPRPVVPIEVTSDLIQKARALADEMFLSRHPRARIEHSDARN